MDFKIVEALNGGALLNKKCEKDGDCEHTLHSYQCANGLKEDCDGAEPEVVDTSNWPVCPFANDKACAAWAGHNGHGEEWLPMAAQIDSSFMDMGLGGGIMQAQTKAQSGIKSRLASSIATGLALAQTNSLVDNQFLTSGANLPQITSELY